MLATLPAGSVEHGGVITERRQRGRCYVIDFTVRQSFGEAQPDALVGIPAHFFLGSALYPMV